MRRSISQNSAEEIQIKYKATITHQCKRQIKNGGKNISVLGTNVNT